MTTGYLAELEAEAEALRLSRRADSTRRAYASDWRHFDAWCETNNLDSLPAAPQAVALYLTELARWAKASTIYRRKTSISLFHRGAGHEDPTRSWDVTETHAGIRCRIGIAQVGKDPILKADLRAMVKALSSDTSDTRAPARDRCLLVVGFLGAFRVSELVGLNVADVVEVSEGLEVKLRRSKTDQEGRGWKIGLPLGHNPLTCPVRALRDWLDVSGISDGAILRPVDRHDNIGGPTGEKPLDARSATLVVKRRGEAVGLDPERISSHSLRAGLATSAAAAGASRLAIDQHLARREVHAYVRHASLFTENAAAAVGL